MTPARPRVLYVSDLAYDARGRRYCDEDIYLTSRLRARFDLAVCHPLDARALMADFDLVVVRNSGPVLNYRAEYDAFRAAAAATGARVYTELTGKGDMAGKQYLIDLFAGGYPVIPTVDRLADAGRLPETSRYVTKPKFGADSAGLLIVDRAELPGLDYTDLLVQPFIDFEYEVSFYYVDHDFQYALHAPRPDRRWDVEPYEPDEADLAFARRFIDWNDITHGIQRVDACRTREGALLLVELEDLNPYLSLDRVAPACRDRFVEAMTKALLRSVS
ncbi:hypothetical protein GCM10010168_19420 [Actinoplanes ianthinogenes]|uniref:ATP-grasp domain-containing protein n=1 Tax=Actinoplanes ianthinogenes TaxID=122358 RepID=A0ABM7M7J5_9ACTN|nr:hypothetical protein [Actinoplanes ianthinogenes]BCJ47584.1 hypothetical protein Aiant_82410 [Actinoplanes ianthinogenes]GGR02766.1 hypothetical protein GCM10010168_19420 [Actinoplanes ianthinogenes]